ncbi:MAG TPA: M90 family metallopeptidase [Gammaproteobacteria bacterium]|nr:M90 family metallopeptidase [Gammaproteobacteria bacterium]
MSPAAVLAVALGLCALVAGWLTFAGRLRAWRDERISARPFPARWDAELRRSVPHYRLLPRRLRARLRRRVRVFLARKHYLGAEGMPIDDRVRLTIAAYACLLIVNRPGPAYPAVRDIVVFPGAFAAWRETVDAAGVHGRRRDVLAGESWRAGRVMLAWDEVRDLAGRRNVVVHEFAHQLDDEYPGAPGAPPQRNPSDYRAWAAVLSAGYRDLRAALAAGRPTLIDAYGATGPAEFFAVLSELFIQDPRALRRAHPTLYAALRDWYRLDPAGWVGRQ